MDGWQSGDKEVCALNITNPLNPQRKKKNEKKAHIKTQITYTTEMQPVILLFLMRFISFHITRWLWRNVDEYSGNDM